MIMYTLTWLIFMHMSLSVYAVPLSLRPHGRSAGQHQHQRAFDLLAV